MLGICERSGEYNLSFENQNQKTEIREENSKFIRIRRDKKGGEEKNERKKGEKEEKRTDRTKRKLNTNLKN